MQCVLKGEQESCLPDEEVQEHYLAYSSSSGIKCPRQCGQKGGPTHFSFCVPKAVPSPPRGVISNVNETSLILEWSEPRDLGGRDDLLYNVICKKCRGSSGVGGPPACSRCDDNVEFVPRQLGLTERRVHISHLLAHTRYTFEVQAVNGVSGKSPLPPRYAAVNITTNQAGEKGSNEGDRRLLSGVLWEMK